METPNLPRSESSQEELSKPAAVAEATQAEELDVDVPTLFDDLRQSRRRLNCTVERWLRPIRFRLSLPIRANSWLGRIILALNAGLLLLAFRDAPVVLGTALMGALGGLIGLAWAAVILGVWAVAPVCAAGVVVGLWSHGKWRIKLQVAAVVATLMALGVRGLIEGSLGY